MQLYPTPENPAPEGAVCVGVTVAKNIQLRVMTTRGGARKGTVVLLNGRADFMERYFETMRDLMAMGYAVASFDWRGQGGSSRLLKDPMRGFVRRIDDYDDDLNAVMTQVVLPDCPPPYFALAHSTGGHILLRALRKRTWFNRAVLSAPLIDVHYGKWPRGLAHCVTRVMAGIGLGRLYLPGYRRGFLNRADFANNPLSSDRKRWNRDTTTLEQHPQLGVGGPTFGWMRAILNGIRALERMTVDDRFCCPMMIIFAGLDRVVDNQKTREFIGRVPGIAYVTIAASQHEILLERDDIRQQFFAAFEAFLTAPSR